MKVLAEKSKIRVNRLSECYLPVVVILWHIFVICYCPIKTSLAETSLIQVFIMICKQQIDAIDNFSNLEEVPFVGQISNPCKWLESVQGFGVRN